MRFVLALGLLISLCVSADAATVHRARQHAIIRPSQSVAMAGDKSSSCLIANRLFSSTSAARKY
jgi:hypothetical protein